MVRTENISLVHCGVLSGQSARELGTNPVWSGNKSMIDKISKLFCSIGLGLVVVSWSSGVSVAQEKDPAPELQVEATYLGYPADYWLKAAGSEDHWLRWRAIRAIHQLQLADDDTIAVLIGAFRDGQFREKLAVTEALVAFGSDSAEVVDVFTHALSETSPGLRQLAAEGLGQLGGQAKAAIPALIGALADKDDGVRVASAEAVGNIGSDEEQVVTALKHALADKDNFVRIRAAESLEQLNKRSEASVKALAEAVEDKRAGVGAAAIQILATVGDDAGPVVPVLASALREDDRDIRLAGIAALQNIGPAAEPAIPALVELLKHKDPETRLATVAALQSIGSAWPSAITAMTTAVKDQELPVRIAAINALGEMGPAGALAVPTLLAMLQDKQPEVRLVALGSLRSIGPDPKSVGSALEAAIHDKEEAVRLQVINLINDLPSDATLTQALISVLNDEQLAVRLNAARTLAQLGVGMDEAVTTLAGLLKNCNTDIQQAAALTIAEMGPHARQSVHALTAAIRKAQDPRVRLTLISVLGTLGPEALSLPSFPSR